MNLQATTTGNGLQVKPAVIVYTGDGTGFIGGASVRNRHGGIRWTRWNRSTALGTGDNQLNNCDPSCAGGSFRGYPVRIEMWRPRTLHGRLMFTRLTIFYLHQRPSGEPAHYTFTDTYGGAGTAGGYSWGPPGAIGYCKDTHGEKPFPGCRNIHALP